MEFKNKWKYHLLLIVVILSMTLFRNYVINGGAAIIESFSYPNVLYFISMNIAFFLIYFTNFYIAAPISLKKNKILLFIGTILLMFILFASFRYLLEEVILFEITGRHNYSENSRHIVFYVFDNTYFALKAILYSTSLFLFFQYVDNKNKLYSLKINQNRAEVDYLKSQISPHFLFNTLNAFYVDLIDDNPKTAKGIHKLSELLRYVIYESKKDHVCLINEVKFLNDYIYFYQKRLENELNIEFKVTGSLSTKEIPSLILIHFIENTFKHGILNDKKNPIKININVTEKHLELATENTFLASDKYTSHGIGYKNVKQRLIALFQKNFILEYSNKNNYYSTYLKIPI